MYEKFDADKVQAERRASIKRREQIRKQVLADQAARDAKENEKKR